MDLRGLIRDVPDFPKAGIVFKDITPLLRDGTAFDQVTQLLATYVRLRGADAIVGIESRGFIFAAAVASNLKLGFLPIRKSGKLPWKTVRETYSLEYGEDAVEVHEDAVRRGQKVVVIDDVLATGGTLAASCRLLERLGAEVSGCACLLELKDLHGRDKLAGRDFHSILTD